jgi:hypothetical protein
MCSGGFINMLLIYTDCSDVLFKLPTVTETKAAINSCVSLLSRLPSLFYIRLY